MAIVRIRRVVLVIREKVHIDFEGRGKVRGYWCARSTLGVGNVMGLQLAPRVGIVWACVYKNMLRDQLCCSCKLVWPPIGGVRAYVACLVWSWKMEGGVAFTAFCLWQVSRNGA